jgi:peptidoglycan hydrolase-like protein with peptidoglycan-binding domain
MQVKTTHPARRRCCSRTLAGAAVALVTLAVGVRPAGAVDEHSPAWVGEAPVLRVADSGEAVAHWQEALNWWLAADPDDDGFRMAVDGRFGPLTDAVTRSLQHEEGIPVDGIVGPVTRAAFLSNRRLALENPDPAADAPVLRLGDRGPAVTRWQTSLSEWQRISGQEPVVVDGAFGPRTDAATRGFQAAQGVTIDGMVGPETLAAMRSAPAIVNRAPVRAPTVTPEPAPVDGEAAPGEATTPAAGICPQATGPVVVIHLGADVASPRCIAVHPDHRLSVVNDGHDAVTVNLAELSIALGPGNVSRFERPIGEYLTPGVHTIHVSRFDGSGPQLWLRP